MSERIRSPSGSDIRLIPLTTDEAAETGGFEAVRFANNNLAFQVYNENLQTGEVRERYPLFTSLVAQTLALRAGNLRLPRIRRALGANSDEGEKTYRLQHWDQPLLAARAVMKAFESGLFRRLAPGHRQNIPIVGANMLRTLKIVIAGNPDRFSARLPAALDELAVCFDTDDLPAITAQVYSSCEVPPRIDRRIRHASDTGGRPRAVAAYSGGKYVPSVDPHSHWSGLLASASQLRLQTKPRRNPGDMNNPEQAKNLPPFEEKGEMIRWNQGVFLDNIPRARTVDRYTRELWARVLKLSCFDLNEDQIALRILPDTHPIGRLLRQIRERLQLPQSPHGSVNELFERGLIKIIAPMEIPPVKLGPPDKRLLGLLLSNGSFTEIAEALRSTELAVQNLTKALCDAFGVATRQGLITVMHGSGLATGELRGYRVPSRWPSKETQV